MAQGLRHESWKDFSSVIEVKIASPAALLQCTQMTEAETANSTGLSGTEIQDVSAEEF